MRKGALRVIRGDFKVLYHRGRAKLMQGTFESYEQVIEYLFGRINYERVHSGNYSSSDFKLDRTRHFLSLLGNPQNHLPAVHIAGTKGKGSTAVMVSEFLSASGYRVGLFTSPHIESFEERMLVNGVPPTPVQLVDLVNQVADPVTIMDRTPERMNPTYFEIATAIAWLFFEQQQVDVVVLEVGLGGRLDATNICNPEVVAMTSISRDHTKLLGSEIATIAREKAGIIKPKVPVISGALHPDARTEIENTCRDCNAPLRQLGRDIHYRYNSDRSENEIVENVIRMSGLDVHTWMHNWPELPLPLLGEHQAQNASVAVGIVDTLSERGWEIPQQAVYDGMAAVKCPLRIEVLSHKPTVVVDAAHNWDSVSALLKTLDCSFDARHRILIFAATKDKDVSGLLRLLMPPFDTVILTQYLNNPRGVPVEELHRMTQSLSEYPVHVASDPSSAWKLANRLASNDDLICVTGSFFIAVEIRELMVDHIKSCRKLHISQQ